MATQYIYSNSFNVTKSSGTISVTGVTLNKSTLNLTVGSTETLVATIAPTNATNKSVTWTSGNTNIATVDSNGKVTAVATGTAVITVTTADGNKTATCGAVITASAVSVTGVTLNKTTTSIAIGSSETLTATIAPSNATNKNVTWTSSNTSIATVSGGVITPVATGTCNITVTTADGSFTATCSTTITSAASGDGILYDVFLVAGQSNMVGWSAPKDAILDAGIPEVLQFNRSNSLVQASFPLDFPDDNAEWVNSFKDRSNGLHIHFAKKYVENGKLASGRKVVLIPCGKGGTSFLGGHWNSTGAMYLDAIARINAFKSAYSGKYEFKGILWHQGESDWELMDRSGSDASIQTQCDTYVTSLKTALTGFRTAMGSDVPIVMGGFADEWVLTRTKVGTIFEPTLQTMCATENKMAFASSDGLASNLPADGGSGGVIHFSSASQRTFGERYYNSYATILNSATVNVTGVTLNKSTTSIAIGSSETLVATISPSNASNKAVTWTSSNTSVATVNSSGVVTPVSAGSSTITVTTADGSKTATCVVTIIASNIAVTGITLSAYNASVVNGGTYQLNATITPTNATNKTITWTTLNDQFLSVDSTGKVTGLQVGTGKTIRATTSNGLYSDCVFSITAATGNVSVTGVTLNKSSTSLTAGSTETLTATIAPADATNKAVTWASNNTSVATVNSSGVVTAVANGTATITVTTSDGSKTASCVVTVSAGTIAVTGVTLNTSSASVITGNTYQLTATVTPSNATDKTVTWSSSNTSVATVDTTGKVTGVATGTATITATASGKTATCSMTVTATAIAVTGVSLNSYNASVTNGGTYQLTATIAPSNATDKTITWSSLNNLFVTVDQTGKVSGIQVGSGKTIRATASNGLYADCAFTITAAGALSILLDKTTSTLVEEQQGTIGVKLSSQPLEDVVVNITKTYSNVEVLPTEVTFTSTNWDTYQNVTVYTSADLNNITDTDTITFSANGYTSAICTVTITEKPVTPTGDGTPIEQQYALTHEAIPNNPSPPTGAYNWVNAPRINPDGSFPLSTWNAMGHWLTTYKVSGASYYDNVGLLLQNPMAWIWNTSTQAWDVISSDFEWGTWYLEDFWNDGSGNIANTVTWEKGESANGSTWVKIKQTSETSGRCFHPWGYQKNWRSNSNWSNNGQPYIVTKVDFKLVKWDDAGVDNLANAQLVVNSGCDWWREVGDVWQSDWSTNRDMAVGKFLLATTTLRRAYCTNLPQNWTKGFPE